jgi:hypothetical protein
VLQQRVTSNFISTALHAQWLCVKEASCLSGKFDWKTQITSTNAHQVAQLVCGLISHGIAHMCCHVCCHHMHLLVAVPRCHHSSPTLLSVHTLGWMLVGWWRVR